MRLPSETWEQEMRDRLGDKNERIDALNQARGELFDRVQALEGERAALWAVVRALDWWQRGDYPKEYLDKAREFLRTNYEEPTA